jgi:hypothetical protein
MLLRRRLTPAVAVEFDPFDEWLHRRSYLSNWRTRLLPAWQRPIAFVQQFAVAHLNGGVGSLFYNHPEKVRSVVASLDVLEERELASKVRQVSEMLLPVFSAGRRDLQVRLMREVEKEPAASVLVDLDALIEQRWDEFRAKMRKIAEENRWDRG